MNSDNNVLTAEKLRKFSDDIKKQKGDTVTRLSNDLCEFVKKTYKDVAQKAIIENVDTKRIEFDICSAICKKLKKLDKDTFYIVKQNLQKEMEKYGFNASVKDSSYNCEICIFRGWICNKMYKVILTWN